MRIQASKLLVLASMLAVAAPLSCPPPRAAAHRTEAQRRHRSLDTGSRNRHAGATDAAPPSDAIVLFDGKNLDEWVQAKDNTPAQWPVADGAMTVDKEAPASATSRPNAPSRTTSSTSSGKIPENITGSDQARGNSGVFLASTGPGDAGYELQILDSYNNKTYVNGQAGSMYKQTFPW